MNSNLKWKFVLVIIACLFLIGWAGQEQSRARRVWEYKIVGEQRNNERAFNELGAQGWELVLFKPYIRDGTIAGGEYYFRRAQ